MQTKQLSPRLCSQLAPSRFRRAHRLFSAQMEAEAQSLWKELDSIKYVLPQWLFVALVFAVDVHRQQWLVAIGSRCGATTYWMTRRGTMEEECTRSLDRLLSDERIAAEDTESILEACAVVETQLQDSLLPRLATSQANFAAKQSELEGWLGVVPAQPQTHPFLATASCVCFARFQA
jgi:hypothetical protein